jgi:hypothetical protein
MDGLGRERLWRLKPGSWRLWEDENGFGKLRPLGQWCSLPANKHGSGFHPIPGIGLAVRRRLASDLTPLESFYL